MSYFSNICMKGPSLQRNLHLLKPPLRVGCLGLPFLEIMWYVHIGQGTHYSPISFPMEFEGVLASKNVFMKFVSDVLICQETYFYQLTPRGQRGISGQHLFLKIVYNVKICQETCSSLSFSPGGGLQSKILFQNCMKYSNFPKYSNSCQPSSGVEGSKCQ